MARKAPSLRIPINIARRSVPLPKPASYGLCQLQLRKQIFSCREELFSLCKLAHNLPKITGIIRLTSRQRSSLHCSLTLLRQWERQRMLTCLWVIELCSFSFYLISDFDYFRLWWAGWVLRRILISVVSNHPSLSLTASASLYPDRITLNSISGHRTPQSEYENTTKVTRWIRLSTGDDWRMQKEDHGMFGRYTRGIRFSKRKTMKDGDKGMPPHQGVQDMKLNIDEVTRSNLSKQRTNVLNHKMR